MSVVLHPGDVIAIALPLEHHRDPNLLRQAQQAAHDQANAFYAQFGVTVAHTTTISAPIPPTVVAVFRKPQPNPGGVTFAMLWHDLKSYLQKPRPDDAPDALAMMEILERYLPKPEVTA